MVLWICIAVYYHKLPDFSLAGHLGEMARMITLMQGRALSFTLATGIRKNSVNLCVCASFHAVWQIQLYYVIQELLSGTVPVLAGGPTDQTPF